MEHIKERSFLHFRSIRMPFDDCRIPGDEMPRLSGVKPWVARDLITAVQNQWQITPRDDIFEEDYSLIANAFICSKGVWYLVASGDYHDRFGVHVIPVREFQRISVYKYNFYRHYAPTVLKDIMQERLNPPPKPAPAAPAQSQVNYAGIIVLGIMAVLLIAVVVLAAYFGESRSSRDDDGWEYNGRGDVYAGRSSYYRGY